MAKKQDTTDVTTEAPAVPATPAVPAVAERKFRVRFPQPGFTGLRFGLKFEKGEAFTTDPAKAAQARLLKYVVEEV